MRNITKITGLLFFTLFPILDANAKQEPVLLPEHAGGVKILPQAELFPSTARKSNYQKVQQDYFPTQNEEYIEHLLKLKDSNAKKHLLSSSTADITDLTVKHDDIKLAFDYPGPAISSMKTIIGFAPAGTWTEDGWSGIGLIFQNPSIGICSYQLDNVKISGGSIFLAAESVNYRVNNKPTRSRVEGTEGVGFLYKLSWYDDVFFHDLECANSKFEKVLINQLEELAIAIDQEESNFSSKN